MAKTPTDKKFYVYRILGEMGETVYIGKGTGGRLAKQMRRFMASGEIIARFGTERQAYLHEKKLIAEFAPPLNRCSGGGGGIYGRQTNAGPDPRAVLARAIWALKHPQRYFTQFDMRPALEKFVADMSQKYGDFGAGNSALTAW